MRMDHTSRHRHRAIALRLQVGVAALAAVVAAGCSSTNSPAAHEPSASSAPSAATSAPATPAAAHHVEAPINEVPWSNVGPGWTLATWSPVTAHRPGEKPGPGEADPETAATTLFLVDPAGNRYAITTLSGDDAGLHLTDWSGDGSHALLSDGTTVVMVDV